MNGLSEFAGVFVIFAGGSWIVVAVIHIGFAVGVYADSRRQRSELVSAELWTLATLVAGPLVALAYWVVHHSPQAEPKYLRPERSRTRRLNKVRSSS